jgi:hypothetical protein
MGLQELEQKVAAIPTPDVFQTANDNAVSPVIESLASALGSFLNRDQVKELVTQQMHEFSCLKQIELKNGKVQERLPDTPRHYLFPEILSAVNINVPVALIGPAGSGKSTVCEQIADALHLPYYLQNGVTSTHELTGYKDAYGVYHGTSFRTAFESGGFILVDEADTSEPAAFKWINTALANGNACFPDKLEPVKRHPDFRIAMAANTYGTGADRLYVGANQIDASTLDRFVFFDFGYDEKLETLLAGNQEWTERVQALRKAAMEAKARVVISPRASLHGAKLLSIGWKPEVVEQRTVWKGIDPDLKKRIEDKVVSVRLAPEGTTVKTFYNLGKKKKAA